MTDTTLVGKSILFLVADHFQRDHLDPLRSCLQSHGATLLFAALNENKMINSSDGSMSVLSNYSFLSAVDRAFDAVIIADDVTGQMVKNNTAALQLIFNSWERGSAVVTVGAGVHALSGANILDNAELAVDDNLRDTLLKSGANITTAPIAISENLLTARADADMQMLCNEITNFLLRGTEYQERRWAA